MKIFVTSDIHGNKALIRLFLKIMKDERVDAVIIAGDITPKGFYQLFRKDSGYRINSIFPINHELLNNKDENEIKRKLDLLGFVEQSQNTLDLSEIQLKQKEKLKEICKMLRITDMPVFLLIGNDDHISESDWNKILKEFGIFNLNLETYSLGRWQITGFQYVLPTPWNTNNELPEEQLAVLLRGMTKQINEKTIFVSHGPPKNILDRLSNGLSVGSTSIRKIIEDKQPMFHIFGHIHESFGQEKFENTLCCNVSCLWLERILRGYIIDMDDRTIKRIEQKISFEDLMLLEKELNEKY